MKKMVECCPPECCDMRGMLSFFILWLLTKKPMHGQELAKEIEKRRGKKPNPGTIYPALEDLRRRSLVRKERKGKTTIYSLTKKGRIGIKKACMYFCKAFGEIFEEYKDVCR
jgi:DNA-binding PadR family transcriptional regulator